jgi:transposase
MHEALRRAIRSHAHRDPLPSAAIMDSRSVKTTVESGMMKGYDGHKQIKGRKRHLLVDTLGMLVSGYVTPANTPDCIGARWLLAGLQPFHPRLERIWADGAYRGEALATWCRAEGDWQLEIIKRAPSGKEFTGGLNNIHATPCAKKTYHGFPGTPSRRD